MVVNDIIISQEMKKKSWLSKEIQKSKHLLLTFKMGIKLSVFFQKAKTNW